MRPLDELWPTDDDLSDLDDTDLYTHIINLKQNEPVYRNTMDSCLLLLGRHTSHCGTMALFSIIEEEWNNDETEVIYARVIFQINCYWVYNWFIYKRRKHA